MSGIVNWLSGADSAKKKAEDAYQAALNREVTATGSPAAQQFGQMQMAAMQPMFDRQNQDMKARLAAMGITHSGAGKNDFSNLASDQSATLAGAVSPLYSEALGQYGNINAQMPGAELNAYQNAINNFYTGVGDAASLFGLGNFKSPGGGNYQGYGPPKSGGGSPPGGDTASAVYSMPGMPSYNPYSTTVMPASMSAMP